MAGLNNIVIPEVMPYLLGILGLLLIWQFHRLQVMAGRIQAVDFWDRSGIRMFLHSCAHDDDACPACREASGTVFLPSVGTKKNFSTLDSPCTNPAGCRCLVVGLYGGWPEAHRLVEYLRKKVRKKHLKLTEQAMGNLLGGDWEKTVSGTADRISIHMVEAMRLQGTEPEGALFRYRFVVNEATAGRDLHFVVPAYMRLTETLERLGRVEEGLEVIKDFEQRYAGKKPVAPFPTEAQRGHMSIRKSRLVMAMSQANAETSARMNLAAAESGSA